MLRCAVTAACILVACGAAGCSSISDKHAAACPAGDWERFGENDGRLGIATQDRADFFEDCSETGTTIDLSAYQAGRSRGLAVYCTPESGFEVGRSGRRYDGVCPPGLEGAFLQGYEHGRSVRLADGGSTILGPDVRVGVGIGVGSRGGVRTGIGIGIGLGHLHAY